MAVSYGYLKREYDESLKIQYIFSYIEVNYSLFQARLSNECCTVKIQIEISDGVDY